MPRRLIFGLVAMAMLALPASAAGTTFNVNALLDAQSDGVCVADGDCTLRDAVTEADGSDTILLPPGTHTVSEGGPPEDANANGDIDVNSGDNPLTIRGTGADPSAVTIDATGLGDRVLDLSTGAEFLIANLTITGGSSADGGAIRNAGPELTLSEVVLDANTAPTTGGAILNGDLATPGSRVTILNSVLSDNRALAGDGGAIRNQEDGRVAIIGSTLSGNRAEGVNGDGGAVFNEDQASLTVATSRLEQNEAFVDGPGGSGGAIFTQNDSSSTTVSDSLVADNESQNGGGGLYANNATSLTVIDSEIRGNHADNPAAGDGGGGIFANNDSAVSVLRSTLSGNSAAFGGGGAMRDNDGVLEIVSSTLSGNSTPAAGGGVHATSIFFGYTRIDHSTIAGNTAGTAGGGIFNSTATGLFEPLIVGGTIVSGNLVGAAPQNCADDAGATPLVSRGFNLDSASTCGFTATGDRQNANPLLGPLADNGGPTPTHAPGATGAAIDAGVSGGHATDQRGEPRTVDQPLIGNAPGSDGTDIGAVELALLPPTPATPVTPVAPLPAAVPTAGGFDLKAAIAKCKKKFPKGKKRKKCIGKARAKASA